MARIKGITVILYDRVETGEDAFGVKTYSEVAVPVENVLVSPVSSSSQADTIHPEGKGAVYNLAIPKGDIHEWKDRKVEFFGQVWKTVGFPYKGIEDMIPLDWNMKVQVEAYE